MQKDARAVFIFPPRHREVLALLLQGLSEKQIARQLGLSPHTVHAYVKSLHKTLAASSGPELLAICYGMLLDDMRRQLTSRPPAPPAPEPRPVVEVPVIEPVRLGPVQRLRRSVAGVRVKVPDYAAYSPGC